MRDPRVVLANAWLPSCLREDSSLHGDELHSSADAVNNRELAITYGAEPAREPDDSTPRRSEVKALARRRSRLTRRRRTETAHRSMLVHATSSPSASSVQSRVIATSMLKASDAQTHTSRVGRGIWPRSNGGRPRSRSHRAGFMRKEPRVSARSRLARRSDTGRKDSWQSPCR
jgi:hypothetical protein